MTGKKSTRDRLLDEAILLIWRLGYNAVSVDAICEAAGANKGSFYYAFASKADLLAAAIDRIWAADRAGLIEQIDTTASATEKLERHLDWFTATQSRLQDEHGFAPGHFHMAVDMNVPVAAAAATRNREEYRVLLRALLEEVLTERGGSVQAAPWLTDTIGHLISGMMIEAKLSNSLVPIEALKPTVLRLVGLVSP